jgi:hypothetical protein
MLNDKTVEVSSVKCLVQNITCNNFNDFNLKLTNFQHINAVPKVLYANKHIF